MRRATRDKLAILAAGVALAVFACSCAKDLPAAPTPIAVTASPSPDPKIDPNSCVQADARITAYNGAGNPDVVFGVGEPVDVRLAPLNALGVPLTNKCAYATVAGWSYAGPCVPFGDLTSLTQTFFCIDPGALDLVATHAGFKAAARLRIVR